MRGICLIAAIGGDGTGYREVTNAAARGAGDQGQVQYATRIVACAGFGEEVVSEPADISERAKNKS